MRLPQVSLSVAIVLFAITAVAQVDKKDAAWNQSQIQDALHAAPVPVTSDARIYAWRGTELVLVRAGEGPYTCVASGSWSLRLGKPALPYPDPLCADQNAWNYLHALWQEADPLHPSRPLPRAPGLVWMLAGMDVVNGRVSYGRNQSGSVQAGVANSRTITMTPHVMILPLSVDAATASLPSAYDPDRAHMMWVMGAGTPTAHLHVHFSPATYEALKRMK